MPKRAQFDDDEAVEKFKEKSERRKADIVGQKITKAASQLSDGEGSIVTDIKGIARNIVAGDCPSPVKAAWIFVHNHSLDKKGSVRVLVW